MSASSTMSPSGAAASPAHLGSARGLLAWWPHLTLVGLAIVMIVVARTRHLSTEAALATAFDASASPDDRIWAMHLVANRATTVDPHLGVDLVESFLGSDSDKVREAAHLVDLCRHAILPPDAPEGAAPPIQDGYAYGPRPGGVWTPHRIRCLVLHRRKVGGSGVGGVRRMELVETQWFLDSLAGKPSPTAREVQEYMKLRDRKAGAPPNQRDSPDE